MKERRLITFARLKGLCDMRCEGRCRHFANPECVPFENGRCRVGLCPVWKRMEKAVEK